ncbi:hypothetical protein EYF80_004507 [Liparis tanakae]|uniref:Uncharacterized protein n=1 Tax=Liparis tanakae TaxID=230148 RepID=A0A4Z2J564_9TELE|nr:hypothetical protein EYF80_004507 [Liparis tanakae]
MSGKTRAKINPSGLVLANRRGRGMQTDDERAGVAAAEQARKHVNPEHREQRLGGSQKHKIRAIEIREAGSLNTTGNGEIIWQPLASGLLASPLSLASAAACGSPGSMGMLVYRESLWWPWPGDEPSSVSVCSLASKGKKLSLFSWGILLRDEEEAAAAADEKGWWGRGRGGGADWWSDGSGLWGNRGALDSSRISSRPRPSSWWGPKVEWSSRLSATFMPIPIPKPIP